MNRLLYRTISLAGGLMLLCTHGNVNAQTQSTRSSLPDAPPTRLLALAGSGPQIASASNAQATASDSSSNASPTLARTQAEQMAIKYNPRVTVARLLAMAQHQVYRETRSIELPSLIGSMTAEEANNASRISSGSLTASRLFEHAGAGANFSQLLFDFGHSRNLVASSKLQEKAQNASALASTEDIVLATDQAFYNALQAQAMLQVARQNVNARQATETQVNQMTQNKLKSTLDLSFANANVSQAQLLVLDAQNNADATMAALDEVLGLDHTVTYNLVDETTPLSAPPPSLDQLIQTGLSQRPDLQAATFNQQAALRFSHAQRDQLYPSISALGSAGSVPIRTPVYFTSNWWGGIGVNMEVPIFNGFLYPAQAKEASIRAQAANEQSRELRDQIVRDIRTAWLAANTAYQRVGVTAQLLQQADLSLKLAQTRYQMGLSSIVELTQAQYQQTDAAITNTNAQYQYRLALATLNYQIGTAP